MNDRSQYYKQSEISVVIAAAGKGSRSGLSYPKCLYKINRVSILARILKNLTTIDKSPTIIVSPSGYEEILDEVNKLKVNAKLIIQKSQKGMGDAVIQLNNIYNSLHKNILLIWGDVPFISKDTVHRLISSHLKEDNSFTLATMLTDQPYTIIQRDLNKNISSIIETKNNAEVSIPNKGERDLGLFLFNKEIILNLLSKDLPRKFNSGDGEHGFLYVIEHLYKNSHKIGSIEVMNKKESISFNSLSDLSST